MASWDKMPCDPRMHTHDAYRRIRKLMYTSLYLEMLPNAKHSLHQPLAGEVRMDSL